MSPTAPLRPRSRTHEPFISTPPKHKTSLPPAALCYYKPLTSPPRQRTWSVAITHSPARMSTFARRKACLRLCPECPRLSVDPKCGSRSTAIAPSLHTGQTGGTLEVVAIASTSRLQTLSPAARPYTPVVHSTTAAEGPLPGIQRHCEPRRGRSRLYTAPETYHRDRRTSTSPAISLPKPPVRQEEMAQVQQMLSNGVIRPSNSPWASPVVMVKKDGSLRFCVDFRQLNAATVKDAHPIPRIDDLLDALHGAHWFSTLDLKSGYWQVPIQERDKEKTAFRTSSGQLFEFNQVPFGLCNAPATFSRLMDRVLASLHWKTCPFYLDDIIVFAATWEEHLARLRQVFERLRHTKLKLGADKCTFAAREVSYLGHRVTEEGLLPDPALLAAIRDISPPQNATEVRSFLGLAGYYRRYVKNFAAIAGLLHALTRKDAVFHWSTDCQDAFDCLKTLLTTSPITAFPDFSLPFRLYTDASTAGLGAILAQVSEGKEHIICCASRSLNQAEKAYPATKLECLAIVWAVAKFRPYLMSIPFEVYIDHYALQWLKTMRTGSALLHRWSAALEEYDFTVKHRPGKSQTHVDGLSCLPVDPPPPEDIFLQVRVLNDEDKARRIARELHTATHLGGRALWKLFRDRYTHKAGRRICLETAQSCPQCQLGTDYGHRQKTTGTMQSQGPWDTLSIDIVGPLPPDYCHEFLIVFVDCYSKYTILIPSSNHTANSQRSPHAACYPVFRDSTQAPLQPRPRVHQCHMDQAPVLARNTTGPHLTVSPRRQRHQRKEPPNPE